MPASNRRDVRSYNTPGIVDGNLARDLRSRELEQQLDRSGQLDFDKQYRQQQESTADKLSRQRQQRRHIGNAHDLGEHDQCRKTAHRGEKLPPPGQRLRLPVSSPAGADRMR